MLEAEVDFWRRIKTCFLAVSVANILSDFKILYSLNLFTTPMRFLSWISLAVLYGVAVGKVEKQRFQDD